MQSTSLTPTTLPASSNHSALELEMELPRHGDGAVRLRPLESISPPPPPEEAEVHPTPTPSARRSGRAFESAFERYIHELGEHSPLSPSEELEHAERIRARRGELWRTLLSYPPLAGAIVDFALAELSGPKADEDGARKLDPKLKAALTAVKKAGSSARHARTTAGGDAFRKATEKLTRLVVEEDQDDLVAKRIAEDVERIRRGEREGLALELRRMPSANRPFLAYSQRVSTAVRRLLRSKTVFAEANLRLVVSMAKKFEYSKIPLADLVQEGNLGLLKAVDRFDHRRGFRFSTYATWWIRHALTRAVYNGARTIRLPVHIQERQRQIAKTRREFERTHGRPASHDEVATRLSISPKKVASADLDKIGRSVSLDAPVSPRAESTLAESISDEDAPDLTALLADAQLIEQLDGAFGSLDAVEFDIVQRRFGLDGRAPETLREVGALHGLSRERIRQIQARALLKMRDALMNGAAADAMAAAE